jgi:hypothetical protein
MLKFNFRVYLSYIPVTLRSLKLYQLGRLLSVIAISCNILVVDSD